MKNNVDNYNTEHEFKPWCNFKNKQNNVFKINTRHNNEDLTGNEGNPSSSQDKIINLENVSNKSIDALSKDTSLRLHTSHASSFGDNNERDSSS